jgi:hypothetical protein
MPSIQGEFVSKAVAQRARDSLANAGVPTEHMRLWNIIPAQATGHSGGDGAARGALIGGALGGAPGVAIGAALGEAWDNDSGGGTSLPQPSGVRLVVDIVPGGPDVRSLLHSAGAANICEVNN